MPNANAFWANRGRARTLRFLAPILVGVPVLATLAQQTQQTPLPPPISVEVKLVRISATVRDKHGQIVPTLDKDDFMLYVDGHPQPVNNFVRQSDLPLTLGLLVQSSLKPDQRPALQHRSDASNAFLGDMLRKDEDKAFVIRFGHKVELLQGLTPSRLQLDPALQLTQTTDSRSGGGVGGTLLYDAICLASNELTNAREGRKALFVFSDGIDSGSKSTLEDAVHAAQRVDTSVYSILVAENFPGPNGKKILERISTETGGHPFSGLRHGLPVTEIFAQAEEELRNEYVFGFVLTPTNTGAGYHRALLTTKQKGLTVQALDGYFSDR
jgi:VWFA-related protein